MSKKLDSFINPEILIKQAAEEDLVKIKSFLEQKIKTFNGKKLNKSEITAISEALNSILYSIRNISNNTSVFISGKKFPHYSFDVVTNIEDFVIRELLREFVPKTIEAMVKQGIQVECQTFYNYRGALYSNGILIVD